MHKASVRTLLASVLALVMVLGLSVTASAAEFTDTKGHWGESSISRWADNGVMPGGEGGFQPDKEMTRAEFAEILCNLMGYTDEAENTFTDLQEGAEGTDAILKLIQAGVMSGNGDGTVSPNTPVSYEQAAVMLCRAMGIKSSGNTMNAAVAALTERGMTEGIGGGGFVAAGHVNRAAMAKLLDNMVSNYVTEDGATVTGEVKGVVIVKAKNVKIENAKLSEPVVVAPAAAEATVSLTGTTTAGDVVVAAKGAKVVVAETASAKAVEVEAPNAGAEIAGKVESVAVAEKAAGASVTVDKSGTVDSVSSSASNAKVDVAGTVKDVSVSGSETNVNVSGTVEKVDVTESAAGTNVKTEAGAKVDNVTSAAKDVTVSGEAGTVGSVTATGESDVKADVAGAEVKNEGTGSVTANGETVAPSEAPAAPAENAGSSAGTGTDKTTAKPDAAPDHPTGPSLEQLYGKEWWWSFIMAPLADHSGGEDNGVINTKKWSDNYASAVTGVQKETVTSDGNEDKTSFIVNVKLTGRIYKHTADMQDGKGWWFGIGIPTGGDAPASTKLEAYFEDSTSGQKSVGTAYTENGKSYQNFYFGKLAPSETDSDGVIKVTRTGVIEITLENGDTVTFKLDFSELELSKEETPPADTLNYSMNNGPVVFGEIPLPGDAAEAGETGDVTDETADVTDETADTTDETEDTNSKPKYPEIIYDDDDAEDAEGSNDSNSEEVVDKKADADEPEDAGDEDEVCEHDKPAGECEVCQKEKEPEDGNTEDGNTENGNTEDGNTEDGNTEDGNTEDGNTEDGNTEDGNTEDGNTEDGNTGDGNTGDGNTEDGNTEDGGTEDGGTGDGGTGETKSDEPVQEPVVTE